MLAQSVSLATKLKHQESVKTHLYVKYKAASKKISIFSLSKNRLLSLTAEMRERWCESGTSVVCQRYTMTSCQH